MQGLFCACLNLPKRIFYFWLGVASPGELFSLRKLTARQAPTATFARERVFHRQDCAKPSY
jgi:hypothetical protein